MPGDRQREAKASSGFGAARRVRFAATGLGIAFVLLAAVELGLRGVGFGGAYPRFVDAEGMPGLRHASAEVMAR
jgi:hypothetical protein